MADEYVLRSSVLNAIHNGDIDMGMVTTHEYRLLKDLSERIDRRIQRVPAADVQPVRHGRWVEVKGFTGVEAFGYREECVDGFACSVCGKEVDVSEGYFRYCPNCGAKMGGE